MFRSTRRNIKIGILVLLVIITYLSISFVIALDKNKYKYPADSLNHAGTFSFDSISVRSNESYIMSLGWLDKGWILTYSVDSSIIDSINLYLICDGERERNITSYNLNYIEHLDNPFLGIMIDELKHYYLEFENPNDYRIRTYFEAKTFGFVMLPDLNLIRIHEILLTVLTIIVIALIVLLYIDKKLMIKEIGYLTNNKIFRKIKVIIQRSFS
ncbi:MAG: hypothetical protein ACFFBP_16000 [Promethearchaeota archaeon]